MDITTTHKNNDIFMEFCKNNNITSKNKIGLFVHPETNWFLELETIFSYFSPQIYKLDIDLTHEDLCEYVDKSELDAIFTLKDHINIVEKILWSCPKLKKVIILDSDVVPYEENILMSPKLWNMISINAQDEIAGGAWINSYTRELLTPMEVNECIENVFIKLQPYLNPEVKVLEIGCSFGITMYKISPYTKLYCAIDISKIAIEHNAKKNKDLNLNNIELHILPADRINEIPHNDFDIIIINSVVQLFHGYQYLKDVINQCIKKIKKEGIIFIGDIMDFDLKTNLENSLLEFKQSNPQYNTKTNFDNELFISKSFFSCIKCDIPQVSDFVITPKIFTIKNELTEFRYDCLLDIKKRSNENANIQQRQILAIDILK